jgi:hypothetical protein
MHLSENPPDLLYQRLRKDAGAMKNHDVGAKTLHPRGLFPTTGTPRGQAFAAFAFAPDPIKGGDG